MIITRLIGGIGNQMFQYACGLSLARRYSVSLKIDVRGFDEQKLRRFSLHHFNISAPVADSAELPTVSQIRSPLVRLLGPWYRPRGLMIVRDYLTGFDSSIFSHGDRLYLDGYWQREKYFTDVCDIVRKEFTLRHPLDSANQNLVEGMRQEPSVSIHIRRGDYVAHSLYAHCSLEYYQRAIEYLSNRYPDIKLYVFSDDPAWVQANLTTKFPTTYVIHNQGEDDYKDLMVMSQCRHHIIANSSFSWWAAWLGGHQSGIVVAPDVWYTKPSMNTGDLVPNNWIQITPK